MTIDEVRTRVATIAEAARGRDHASAHTLEDELFLAVLRHIAASDDGPSGDLAREAVKAEEVDFDRWL